jgi:hypothetical protein
MWDGTPRLEETMKILLAFLARALRLVAALEARTALRPAPVLVRK